MALAVSLLTVAVRCSRPFFKETGIIQRANDTVVMKRRNTIPTRTTASGSLLKKFLMRSVAALFDAASRHPPNVNFAIGTSVRFTHAIGTVLPDSGIGIVTP